MSSTEKAGFFKRCPKTNKIIGLNLNHSLAKWAFPITGLLALIWFCIRVLPKPSRLSYPCQKAAAPMAAAFLSYILGITGVTIAFRNAHRHFRAYRFGVAIVCVLTGLTVAVFFFTPLPGHDILAEDTGTFTPSDSANSPIGVARGIFPGRVAWAFDSTASTWNGTSNYWWSTTYNNQAKVTAMLDAVVCSVAGKDSVAAAWDTLFKNKNGGAPYVKGEKIAIKLNLNNNGKSNAIDASPQSVYALLDQLVNKFGVNQTDITLCDPARENQISAVKTYCKTTFPSVHYDTALGGFTANCIQYAAAATGTVAKDISTTIYTTKYLIVMALIKRHCTPATTWGTDGVDYGNAPVTMIFKSNWGVVGANRSSMHWLLHDWSMGLKSYDVLVDMEGSKYINGKTVLNILDGLYTGARWNAVPVKWKMAPFNNGWMSSMFASQDPVALESVGTDFLRSEMPLTKYADRCLHEAALANNPPSGTVYAPDGVRLQSLGVHEHWNNAIDKKYSRNLNPATGTGIQLLRVSGTKQPTSITGSVRSAQISSLALVGAYPNPAVHCMNIRYSLPTSGIRSVQFSIIDVRGRTVWQKMVSGNTQSGLSEIRWNGHTVSGQAVVSGNYVVRMTASDAHNNVAGVFEKTITFMP
jgi:hypothetical protein